MKKDKALTIVNFSKQTELDLEFELQNIPHPEKVEILLLDSLQLKTLPKNCVLFKNLKHISLAYNPNLDFNNAFELLKNLPLEFLNLKGNDLKILPKNIAKLQSITDLNIAYNKLQNEVNYTRLAALKNLSELWLDHNELYEVPKTIGKLDQIIRLYIDNNFLTTLAPEMKNMKKLRVLHAGFNQLNSFPEVFIEMPGLILAHLNNNRIQSFPKIYETKKYSLKGLILDNNPIPKEEIDWAKKEFSAFFLLSFQQKK
ncbi:leucine-rich repeat domain-containing protein [Flavicella sediminum]|uniref:leucine-rich repeat domain-containing protein n=1 Tax=Flavicella sediminum TaxID=2585141 RepID=UPI00111DB25C|nr:hypothetical protein [Flavicella sediminum]